MSEAAPNHRRWSDAAEHVATYRATDGTVGHTWHDRPHLLLSTTGRRSGREHTVPLVYAPLVLPSGPHLVVVASAGGAERHPAWYLNLAADPQVGVHLRGDVWRTGASTAVGAEEEAAWRSVVATWDGFDTYRRRTRRQIPVVLLPDLRVLRPGDPPPEARDALP